MQKPIIYSAPMAGITDKPFRLILRKFTNQPIYTEMIGIATLFFNHPQTRKMLQISDEKNLIVQLVGIEEKYMVSAAKEAYFYGAKGIDINMGCPVKKLITNGSGASLMKDTATACRLVEAVKKAVDIPVSVKTRTGWDETSLNVVDFALALESAGADRVTVHGRTKTQGYGGVVNYDLIRKVKEQLKIPVIANGDIVDKSSATSVLAKTKADGLMVGRGLLGKPWLLNEIDDTPFPSFMLSELVLEHLDLMLSYYGLHGLMVDRKHLAWYASGFEGKADFCNQVYAEKEVDKVQKIIKDFFNKRISYQKKETI